MSVLAVWVSPLHLEVVESTVATTHSGCNASSSHNLTVTGDGCTPIYLVENTTMTEVCLSPGSIKEAQQLQYLGHLSRNSSYDSAV